MTENSNSLKRMLELLPLFASAQSVLSMEEIMSLTGYSRSTAYRYVRTLADVGLLTPVAGRAYSLGPLIIELDRSIRMMDPLLQVAPPFMEMLTRRTGQAVILGRYFRRNVVCVHQEGEAQGFVPTFGRGREMPAFSSATSRVILAHLPAREVKDIYLSGSDAIADADMGEDWNTFRTTLRDIRAQGFAISKIGAVDAHAVGVAAPLFDSRNICVAAVSLVSSDAQDESYHKNVAGLVVETADEISTALCALETRLKKETEPAPEEARSQPAPKHRVKST